MADALSAFRLLLAAALPFAFARGGWLPLLLWGVAAATDYLDGPLARRLDTVSARGAVLDNVADVAFVLTGLVTACAHGLLSPFVPLAVAASVAAYVVASQRLSAGRAPRLARSRLGHAAGVVNYACVGLAAGSLALPGAVWGPLLVLADLGTVTVNLLAAGARWLPRPRSA